MSRKAKTTMPESHAGPISCWTTVYASDLGTASLANVQVTSHSQREQVLVLVSVQRQERRKIDMNAKTSFYKDFGIDPVY